jgi:DNA mismatch endonuclease (patch repair protein)
MKMTTALAKKRSDVFTKAKRSEVMRRILGRGNKDTEVALAKLFHRNKITGWRRQVQISTSP